MGRAYKLVSLRFMFLQLRPPHMTLTKRYGKPTTPAMARPTRPITSGR
jgi:hypothetical protein